MLPKNYKFHLVNNTGESFDGTGSNDTARITTIAWKFNTTGALVYGVEATGLDVDTVVADSGNVGGSAQDNSSALNLGLHGKFTVDFLTGTPTGSMLGFVELATDGSTFPSDVAELNASRDLTSIGSIAFTGGPSEHSVNFIL